MTLSLRSSFYQQHQGDKDYIENKQSVIRDKRVKAFTVEPDVDPVEGGLDIAVPEEFT